MAATGASAAPQAVSPAARRLPASNFQIRVLSAAVLIPPVVAAVHFGGVWFDFLVVLFGAGMLWEWYGLARRDVPWLIAGTAYILAACWVLHGLRGGDDTGRNMIYFVFAVTWATDTGAYLAGRAFGGPKLAPRVSPSKTWSGAFGGLLAGVGAGILVWWLAAGRTDGAVAAVAAAASVACQLGDLLESGAKRHFNVKDSGSLIPGHGGILDRVDGLLAAALTVGLCAAATGWSGLD